MKFHTHNASRDLLYLQEYSIQNKYRSIENAPTKNDRRTQEYQQQKNSITHTK